LKRYIGRKRENNVGIFEFTGAYYLAENKIEGSISTKPAE